MTVSLYDVEQVVRRILASASAAVSAQKDGTVVSDGYRSFNFQGAGVTVAEDAAMRRTNVNIPGAPASNSATTYVSSTAAKALSLWVAGANTAPPANWQTPGFSDAGWAAAVSTGASGAFAPPSGSTAIWPTASPASNTEQVLTRQAFTIPAGPIVSASITVRADEVMDVYINGTFLVSHGAASGSGITAEATYSVPTSLLTAGASNLIAVRGYNFNPTGAYVAYKLSVGQTTAGLDSRYELIANKGAINGYAGLDAGALVPTGELGTGTASGTTFLRGDQTWAAASTNSVTVDEVDGVPSVSATHLTFPNGTLTDNGGGHVTYAAPTAAAAPYVNVQDQKAQNTAGGTFTSGAWQTRTLNTLVADTGSIASLASNRVTLPAGTYLCRIKVPAEFVNHHQARLQDITGGTTLLTGTSEFASTAAGMGTSSWIEGVFTLAASHALEVQHQCGTTNATNGFGSPANFTTEIYTVAEFWKLS